METRPVRSDQRTMVVGQKSQNCPDATVFFVRGQPEFHEDIGDVFGDCSAGAPQFGQNFPSNGLPQFLQYIVSSPLIILFDLAPFAGLSCFHDTRNSPAAQVLCVLFSSERRFGLRFLSSSLHRRNQAFRAPKVWRTQFVSNSLRFVDCLFTIAC